MIGYISGGSALPFIGSRSGASKWLEDLSRNLHPLKSLYESMPCLFEYALIHDIVYPFQKSLISERLLDEVYKRKEDNYSRAKVLTGEQKGITASIVTNSVSSLNRLSKIDTNSPDFEEREKENRAGLEKSRTRELKIDLDEIEKVIPKDSEIRDRLLKSIIYRESKDIENISIPGDMRVSIEVLNSKDAIYKSSKKVSKESLEGYEDASRSIAEKRFWNTRFSISKKISSDEFRNILSERISSQLSKLVLQEFLKEKSSNIKDSNQAVYSFNSAENHHLGAKSLDSEKISSDNGFRNILSEGISNQFSKHIEGIRVSQEFLEEKSRMRSHSMATELKIELDKSDVYRHFVSPLKTSEKHRSIDSKIIGRDSLIFGTKVSEKSESIVDELVEQTYSNYENKTIVAGDRKFLLNLVEKINQVLAQRQEQSPREKNIFNIHITDGSASNERDLRDLSDRLVLILKEQARRHGIDLS